jgi:hypothetical protein
MKRKLTVEEVLAWIDSATHDELVQLAEGVERRAAALRESPGSA